MTDTLHSEANNEALIQEMLRDAKPVELTGELTKNPVVHQGDADMPAPMTVKELTSAGYVYVWDTRTYQKIPVLYYMLPAKMRQKRKDSSFRFTTTDPRKQPAHGTIKCMLHLESENRAHYNELGFRSCPKSNINNQYQLEQHMVKKHPQEWAAIKAEKAEKERKEDRELQHLLLRSQLPKEGINLVEPKLTCDKCGYDFGTQKVLDKHKLTCKEGGV